MPGHTHQRVTDSATLTVAMIEAAPTPIVLPTIAGTETEGETLTATPGLWVYDGPDPGDQTWAWQNDTSGALGDTDLSYTLQASDVGDTISIDETFGGVTISSASTGAIAAADATAPVLSSPTGAANGSDGATSLGVTTDEGNGTLYWGIYPTASTPSAADVVAGTGATVSGSQAVSATGVQAVSDQTGLSSGSAYKAHYVQDDAATSRSNLATSAEFTPAAAFDPIDLFTGANAGTEGYWIEPDTSKMWTNAGRTVNVTTDSSSIGAIDDKSGNGWEWTAVGTSPVFRDVGGKQYITNVNSSGFNSGNQTWSKNTDFDVYVGLKTSSANGCLYTTESASWFVGRMSDGSTSTVSAGGSATGYFADSGAAISPANRDTLHTAWSTGAGVVAIAEGINGGVGAWKPTPLYFSGALTLDGDIYCIIAVENSVSQANRADIISYIQGLF